MIQSKCPGTLNFFLNHSSIYKNIAKDNDPEWLDASEVLSRTNTFFFLEDGVALLFFNVGGKVYEGDIYSLPRSRGATAKRAAKQAINYMFEQVGAEKIVAQIPAFNKQSKTFTVGLGFKPVRVSPETWTKNGKNYSIFLYELEK